MQLILSLHNLQFFFVKIIKFLKTIFTKYQIYLIIISQSITAYSTATLDVVKRIGIESNNFVAQTLSVFTNKPL